MDINSIVEKVVSMASQNQSLIEPLKSIFGDKIDFSSILNGGVDAVKTQLNELMSNNSEMLETVKTWLASLDLGEQMNAVKADVLSGDVTKAASDAVAGGSDVVSKVTDMAKGAVDAIKGIFGGNKQ